MGRLPTWHAKVVGVGTETNRRVKIIQIQSRFALYSKLNRYPVILIHSPKTTGGDARNFSAKTRGNPFVPVQNHKTVSRTNLFHSFWLCQELRVGGVFHFKDLVGDPRAVNLWGKNQKRNEKNTPQICQYDFFIDLIILNQDFDAFLKQI